MPREGDMDEPGEFRSEYSRCSVEKTLGCIGRSGREEILSPLVIRVHFHLLFFRFRFGGQVLAGGVNTRPEKVLEWAALVKMGSFLPCPAFSFCGVLQRAVSGIIWWRGVEKGSKETGMAAEFSPSEISATSSPVSAVRRKCWYLNRKS